MSHRVIAKTGKREQPNSKILEGTMKRIFLVLVVIGSFVAPSGKADNGQIPRFVPNDPFYAPTIAERIRLPEAYFRITEVEGSRGPNYPEVVVAVLDSGVDFNHPDLAGQTLPHMFENFADDIPPFPDEDGHGTSMAGKIAAVTNNGFAVSSPSGLYPGRVKLLSCRVGNMDGRIRASWVRDAFRRILELKEQGVNIIAANCSFVVGDDDPVATRELLLGLRKKEIAVFAAANTSENPVNIDSASGRLPESYGRDPELSVITITLNNGDRLSSKANWGPQTVSFTVDAMNSPGIGPMQKDDGAVGFGSGTSGSTAIAAGCFTALVQYGPEPKPLRALERMKRSARPFTDPVLGSVVRYGEVDLYAALTDDIELPLPVISSVFYNGGKKIIIRGSNFSSFPRVVINGQEVTDLIRIASDGKIKIKGPRAELGLQSGANTIQVIDATGGESSFFTLTM
jgi:subtilisin family serine protease